MLVPVLAELITFPFDTFRRHLILDAARSDGQQLYTSAADCFAKLAGDLDGDGVARLFQGAGANMVRTLCATAVTAYLVEPLVSRLRSAVGSPHSTNGK